MAGALHLAPRPIVRARAWPIRDEVDESGLQVLRVFDLLRIAEARSARSAGVARLKLTFNETQDGRARPRRMTQNARVPGFEMSSNSARWPTHKIARIRAQLPSGKTIAQTD